MYINKKIAETAAPAPPEPYPAPVERSHHRPLGSALESQAEIARSCREALSSYEDPTIMLQLQKDLAIRDERCAAAWCWGLAVLGLRGDEVVHLAIVCMQAMLPRGGCIVLQAQRSLATCNLQCMLHAAVVCSPQAIHSSVDDTHAPVGNVDCAALRRR